MSDIILTISGSTTVALEVLNGDTIDMTVSPPAIFEIEALGGRGPTGPTGPTGIGVPPSGLIGQHLTKRTAADYDTEWTDVYQPPAGLDKQVQYNDGGVFGSDTDFRYDKNNKTLVLGFPDALPNNPLAIGGTVETYLQVNIQNTSEHPDASSDYICTEDSGDDEFGYGDLGICSSVFDSAIFECTKAHDVYVLGVTETDLVLAAGGTPTSKNRFYAGGLLNTNHVLDITPSGIVLDAGKTITDRPPVFYGTSDPPTASGLPDGALFFKYTP